MVLRWRLVVTVLVLAMAPAACGGGGSGVSEDAVGPSPATGQEADMATARTIVLQQADMPAGWRSVAHSESPLEKERARQLSRCLGRPEPDRVLRWGRPALLPLSSVACVATEQRVVALTYDDGPDPENTPAVLDALAAFGATATFFVLADRAEKHPELLRRIVAEGHDVGLHGEDHTRLSTLSAREALTRIRRGRR